MFDSGAMNFAPDSGLLSRYFGGGGEWESCSVVQNSPVADELLIGEISSFFALRRLTLPPRQLVAYFLSWGLSGVEIFS